MRCIFRIFSAYFARPLEKPQTNRIYTAYSTGFVKDRLWNWWNRTTIWCEQTVRSILSSNYTWYRTFNSRALFYLLWTKRKVFVLTSLFQMKIMDPPTSSSHTSSMFANQDTREDIKSSILLCTVVIFLKATKGKSQNRISLKQHRFLKNDKNESFLDFHLVYKYVFLKIMRWKL